MKTTCIPVEDAVGMPLAHDVTRIVPGEFKGILFRRGHEIRKEDIEPLRKCGKDTIYILELESDEVHEEDAAAVLAKMTAGAGLEAGPVGEGKITLRAACFGVIDMDEEIIMAVNEVPYVVVSTKPNHSVVQPGDPVAAVKVIPLAVKQSVLDAAKKVCGDIPPIRIREIQKKKIGLVITGNEVYYGRIEDKFEPVIRQKAKEYHFEVLDVEKCPDDQQAIEEGIRKMEEAGADIIICTGGMSVDPDDRTPAAILKSGAELVTYGSPVLPGAMFLLAYKGDRALIGMPASGIFAATTVLDKVLPRILTEERLTKKNIAALSIGGLL